MRKSPLVRKKRAKKALKKRKSSWFNTCQRSFGWIFITLFATLLLWWSIQTLYDTPTDTHADTHADAHISEHFHFTQAFDFTWPAHTPKDLVLEEKTFTIAYKKQHRGPIWGAYVVEKMHTPSAQALKFLPDKRLPLRLRLALQRQPKAPLEQRPLIVSEELAVSTLVQQKLQLQRNLTLQLPDFSENIWKKLALQTCQWAEAHGPLYVVSGVFYSRQNTRVPSHFYKVILLLKQKKQAAIAFFIPHTSHTQADIFQFAQSVDQLEKRLHMDFFPRTPQKLQDHLEAHLDLTFWQ